MNQFLKVLSASILLSVAINGYTQTNSVSIGTTNTKTKAVLWLKNSGGQGLLLPSVSTTERTGMALNGSDETGMIVYDNQIKQVFYWDGANWNSLSGGSSGSFDLSINGNQISLTGDATPVSLASTTPTANGQLLMWDNTNKVWTAGPAADNVTIVLNGSNQFSVKTGTAANNIVQLNASAKLPAVDGSLLTNLPTATVADGSITGGTAGPGVKIAAATITDANISASGISTPGKVSGSAITGTIGGSTIINTTGNITAGNFSGNGSGLTSLNASSISSGTLALARITTGTNGNVLSMSAGAPVWLPPATNGTVTTVTATLPISVATPTTTPALSIAQATTTTDGYLKAGDWNTFNGKLDNKLTTIGDIIYQSGAGPNRLPIGSVGNVLTVTAGGLPTWSLPSVVGTAGGDLTGTYPNPTIANTSSTGTNIISAINSAGSGTIAGGKVTPSFGSQNITTTGTANVGGLNATSTVTLSSLAGVGTRVVTADPTGILNSTGLNSPFEVIANTNAVEYIGNSTLHLKFNNTAGQYELGQLGSGSSVFTSDWNTGNTFILGNLGIGTTPSANKLDVNGDANVSGNITASGNVNVTGSVTAPTTGSSNLIPIAYGNISSAGVVNSGTGNFTAVWNGSWYEITIASQSYFWTSYITTVTPLSGGVICSTGSVSGKLLVTIQNLSGTNVQSGFAFTVFKP